MSTFYIQQFGCRATQADGAALERQLLDRGYNPAPDPAQAQIVVLNTCTVTAAADAQARDAIRKLHAQNPQARLIVTGCYAQRAPEELAQLPGVTHVVGNSHKPQIPNLITQIAPAASARAAAHLDAEGAGLAPPAVTVPSSGKTFIPSEARNPLSPTPPEALNVLNVGAQHAAPHLGKISKSEETPYHAQILTGDIFAHPEFLSAPIQGGESHHTRPILKIQDGCNNRCSFCIIPHVRGKSRSFHPDAVIQEIRNLTSPQVAQPILAVRFSSGSTATPVAHALPLPVSPTSSISSASFTSSTSPAKEIVISGINLGTYGRDLHPRTDLLTLIRRILDETSIQRLRLSSIEPQDVTQDLIHLFAQNDRLAQHFHIPLQSASNKILAAMHRWYRAEHYARRLDLIHSLLPHAAIGADVIAGHPGETDEDHAATVAFIEQHPFTYLHVFSYSARPGTKAATAPDQVPPSVIKQRARQLRALSEAKSAAFRQSQQGRTLRVLTLHRDQRSINEQTGAEHTPALSSNYLRVQVPGIFASNEWMDVAIKSEEGSYLAAEIGEPASSHAEFSALSVLAASSV